MAHGNHWGEAVSVFISAKQKAHSHTVISPEKHSSDGWMQMERTSTNISSGTFWNYWCSPFRSIGNVFCIKIIWNGFTYSWNKSRKKSNSQSAVKCCLDMACPVLTAVLTAAQDPQKTEPAQTPARMRCRTPGLSLTEELQHRWLLGWEVTLYCGYGGRGSPVDSPITMPVWAALTKLPGSSETKPMALGESTEGHRGAEGGNSG